MLTYNEVVDKLEKVNPDKIASDVQKQIDDAEEEIMREVDEKLANVKKCYQHCIIIRRDVTNQYCYVAFNIFTDNNTPFTKESLATYLKDNGMVDVSKGIAVSGFYQSSTDKWVLLNVHNNSYTGGATLDFQGYKSNETQWGALEVQLPQLASLTDTVLQIN